MISPNVTSETIKITGTIATNRLNRYVLTVVVRRSAYGAKYPVGKMRMKHSRSAWFAPIVAVTLIVVFAWAASLAQATPEIFVAASLAFSIAEGIVLAFVGCLWSSRGVPIAVVVAAITGVLAAPGRWEVAYLHTAHALQAPDLLTDLGVTVAWGAFAGLAGATILRERLRTLLPGGG
jgi:hypothetical protein